MSVSLKVALKPAADTFCAVVKSMLDHLGDKHPLWEVEGLSGYAFRILVHQDICPSGPHQTKWKELHPETMRRLGWEPRFFLHIDWERGETFDSRREHLIEQITSALDEGQPVAVYDVYVPGWALVSGYDRAARRLSVETFINIAHWKTVDYDKLGSFNLPILYALAPGKRIEGYDREQAYRDALNAAIAHYNLQEYTWRPAVRDGKQAYGHWLAALTGYPEAKCLPEGMADYAAKFGEWRKSAAKFCREAASMFPKAKSSLNAAAKDFDEEAAAFARLAKLFPLPGGKGIDKSRVAQAILLVQKAQRRYNAAIADLHAAKF
jgi:hypothetical protein